MLRRMFSSSKATRAKAPSAITRPEPEKLPESLAGQVVSADSERQLYRYKMPEQERGMTDLINSHQSGNRFQYVALTGSDIEDHSSRIRRLVQHTPRISKHEIPLGELPSIELYKDMERFPLNQALPRKGKRFINLNKATIVFTPLTSFADDYSVMKCSLMDSRMRSRSERSSVKANTNIQVKLEFAMDHCIPREAADQIFLVFNRECANMNAGNMWGVVQVQLEIIESDKPFMENMREVVGVLALPSAGLETFEKDPMHLDITLHNNHRERLQEFYVAGEVADETEPMKEKTKKITYAKSSMPGTNSIKATPDGRMINFPVGNHPVEGGDWSFMKGPRKSQIPDDQDSFSVEDDLDANSDSSSARIHSENAGKVPPTFDSDNEDDGSDLFVSEKIPQHKSAVPTKSAMKKVNFGENKIKVSDV